jgi:LmbE family N-acetylglucosaminyl deacetylase
MRTHPGTRLKTAAALAFVLAVAGPASAQLEPIPQDRGANGTALALRRIGVLPRVLYVTAHPDDESNGMLVRLSRGLGVRTALLTLTRGDGGQNAVGPELFDALAVLRTEELAAVHRYDGVEQYFGQSSDFGYSFSVEETLARWGHEQALGDVVRTVRAFRPDVIITLPIDAVSGGLHHQAAARLAREAFRAAADPARFPEQGLPPWQAFKIYQGGVGGGATEAKPTVTVRTGTWDPLLGLSWQQFGSVARGMHRSQSSGQRMAAAGEGEATFILLDSAPAVAGPETDVLDGLDRTLTALLRYAPNHEKVAPSLRADLDKLQTKVDAIRAAFDPAAPGKTVDPLLELIDAIRVVSNTVTQAPFAPEVRADLAARLDEEDRDAQAALWLAHGLRLEATADDDVVVPGQEIAVTARIVNQGSETINVEGVSLFTAPGWAFRILEGRLVELPPGAARFYRYTVTAPAEGRASQPYWRRQRAADRYEIVDPAPLGRPWAPPELSVVFRYRSGNTVASHTEPVQWRYDWPGGGEKQKTIAIASEFSVRVQPEIAVFPAGTPAAREVRVTVRNARKGPASGRVRLEAPAGWSVEPADAAVRFAREDDEVPARFTVTAGGAAPGEAALRAVFTAEGGGEWSAGDQVVAYEHIQERRLVRPAVVRALVIDVATAPGTAIGYVDGAGDETDAAIRQLGVPLTYLSADDLAFGDLERFTTIVTGVRAYETRPDLRAFHHRLMRYVEGGGNLVVQYNRPEFNQAPPAEPGAPPAVVDSPFAPFPASVTSERVTDENAPPHLLRPDAALLSAPNRIQPADWAGWVQERGLNFLATRDARYENVVAFTDTFPLNAGEKTGALVDAKVGRGHWTYVGLGLFRELPAGVPGAYRMLANLVARPLAR